MTIKQISIFVENKAGRLAEITEVLADAKIDIRALSIADTTDYGILRMIVSNPDEAVSALKKAEITAAITPVLAVCVADLPGGFSTAIRTLADGGMSVEYAYAFITPKVGNAYVILRVEDNDKAVEILNASDIKVITQAQVFDI